MVNLLEETLEHMKEIGKTPNDVRWVGVASGQHTAPWDVFRSLARKIDYDNGYGIAEIAVSLVILYMDNTWSSRQEYGGSEWWKYNNPPKEQAQSDQLTADIINPRWG